MGATEVTVGQFRRFVNDIKYVVGDDGWQNPGFEQTDDHPVASVSWRNAVDFCTWLSRREGKTYRLPTEAEWEYGCRAGRVGTRYGFGNNEDGALGSYGWYGGNASRRTHPVAQLNPNAWGLYDMHGNVWEWCQDYYAPTYYRTAPKQNPPGPDIGNDRVTRGGSWAQGPVVARAAFRQYLDPSQRFVDHGFRVVLVVSPPK
jgi:formylglycine-generating enzyme required for sulfatase activity